MHARTCTAAGAVAVLLSIVGVSTAQAAPTFHCEASALRATIASQTVEPITQGRSGDCATGAATPSVALPMLLDAQTLIANSAYDPVSPSGSATGGIAHLRVLPTPELVAQLPTEQAIEALKNVPVDLSGLPALAGLLGLPLSVNLDLSEAVRALVPVPGTALLSADVLNAQANVGCQGAAAVFSGSSQVIGVKLLGQDVPVDNVVSQAITVLGGGAIDPSRLDPNKVKILGLPGLPLGTVQSVLGQVPPITLPPSVLRVQLTPNQQLRGDDSLTQRALHASISLLDQPVLDAVLGEANVSAAAGTCAPPAAPPAARPAAVAPAKLPAATRAVGPLSGVGDQMLACTDRKLVLVDVLKKGSRVKLLGAADRRYVGKKVAIRLRATGRIVAHAVVHKDGSFQTTAAMPPRAFLATHKRANGVRYRAEIGKELSLPLKLQRRLIVKSLTSKHGKVTVTGRVVRPLTTPVSEIRLVRRVSCHKVVLVKRFTPNADGTFRVTVNAPRGQAAAVYRMVTRVREKASNPRSYPTFTLPRGVALNTR